MNGRTSQPIQFDNVADIYDDYVRTDFDIPFWLSESKSVTGKVLELACGTGRVSIPLLKAGVNLFCVDYAPRMLDKLRTKREENHLSCAVICQDIAELALADRFDLIFIPFHSFSEILQGHRRRSALERIRDHLTSQGRFICTLQNPTIHTCSMDGATRPVGEFRMENGDTLVVRSRLTFDPSSQLAADSIRIDSAVVVFQRIKFESHIDSVRIDTTALEVEDEREFNVTFRGPYVVHVRDTVSIDFADHLLPAGSYNGIKFKIHRLEAGEKYEDSDEYNNRPRAQDDSEILGGCIVTWGSVKKDGSWASFVYKYNGEVEFKMKGNYTVPESTSTVNIVLRFDMGVWFRNLNDGSFLDPTDTSSANRALIAKSVHHSFERRSGGHDSNRDGHPDDD